MLQNLIVFYYICFWAVMRPMQLNSSFVNQRSIKFYACIWKSVYMCWKDGVGERRRGGFLYADRIESNPLIDRGHWEHVWQGCASNRDTVDT